MRGLTVDGNHDDWYVPVLITKMTCMQSEWKTYGTYEEKQYCHMNSLCLKGNSDKWRLCQTGKRLASSPNVKV